ncbi:MAG TPA: Zn-ribbon domain-containing OB-fold protein [Advenella sp.]|nr:Zn-ribbon domain-containing OB-fold protein [Advenella sp.]
MVNPADTTDADTPGVQQTYFRHLAEGRFVIQCCAACSHYVFYPRTHCPHCGSDRLEWVEASGKGVIYSYSIVRRKPEAGGDYNVVLVDLEEGVRCMSRVEDVTPDELDIDMPVQAYIEQTDSGPVLLMRKRGRDQ